MKSAPCKTIGGAIPLDLRFSVAANTRLKVFGCELIILSFPLTLTIHFGISPSEQINVFAPLFPETSFIDSIFFQLFPDI